MNKKESFPPPFKTQPSPSFARLVKGAQEGLQKQVRSWKISAVGYPTRQIYVRNQRCKIKLQQCISVSNRWNRYYKTMNIVGWSATIVMIKFYLVGYQKTGLQLKRSESPEGKQAEAPKCGDSGDKFSWEPIRIKSLVETWWQIRPIH